MIPVKICEIFKFSVYITLNSSHFQDILEIKKKCKYDLQKQRCNIALIIINVMFQQMLFWCRN